MEIDINTLRGLATLMVTTAFLGVCFWAYSSKRKTAFNDAANIPFADEALSETTALSEVKNNHE